MRCPLCDIAMREVERRGVLIDVCPECRGVWLDRGELDKLLTVADRAQFEGWEEFGRPRRPADEHVEERRQRRREERVPPYHGGEDYHHSSSHQSRKKKSWLKEFFDFEFGGD